MVFPIIKLVYLAVRQISKPFANKLKAGAKTSPFLRQYICVPPGQLYHWLETRSRLNLMGLKVRGVKVHKLPDDEAAELGADMLGEFFIFAVASIIYYSEWRRSSKKEQTKEKINNVRLAEMESRLIEQGVLLETIDARIREMNRSSLTGKNITPIGVTKVSSDLSSSFLSKLKTNVTHRMTNYKFSLPEDDAEIEEEEENNNHDEQQAENNDDRNNNNNNQDNVEEKSDTVGEKDEDDNIKSEQEHICEQILARDAEVDETETELIGEASTSRESDSDDPSHVCNQILARDKDSSD